MSVRSLVAGTIALLLPCTAAAQTTSAARPSDPVASPPPGSRLGGAGRRTLGGPGAIPLGERMSLQPSPAPPPQRAPARSSFQVLTDAIDRAIDPD